MESSPRLTTDPTSPKGKKARARANLDAIRLSQTPELVSGARVATEEERHTLQAWSGWGGLKELFEEDRSDWAPERDALRALLSPEEYQAAQAGIINAHYTHPAYADAIWTALADLGINSGEVLEPGVGSGTFVGLAPADVHMTGIELDPTTAAITQQIYPDATIHAESFADTPLRRSYDAAVGNVPFDTIRLFDKVGNPGNHSIHNHFIIKSLDQVKPGGMVAVLTSRYTLDAQNPAARRDMYERADLIGAVRLPSGAHDRIAGTEAVTDLVIFRKRKDGETPQPFNWEHTQPVDLPGSESPIYVNSHFQNHPENVLGTMRAGHGMYGSDTLLVDGATEAELGSTLTDRLSGITSAALEAGLGASPEDVALPTTPIQDADLIRQFGNIRQTSPTTFERLTENGYEDLPVPKTQRAELGQLLSLRDQARHLIEVEGQTRTDTPALAQLRSNLHESYNAYVEKHGPLNRATVTATIREKTVTDKVTGEKITEEVETINRRVPPVMRVFARDPFAPLVYALEKYDQDTGIAKPAPILYTRQIFARYQPKGADTPDDALAMTVESTGKIDLPTVAYLLDVNEERAREMLGDRVFDTPDGDLVTRAEYLSGNVRTKLAEAKEAALENPAFAVNVAALESVMPAEITIPDLKPTLGAPWIPASDIQQFARQLLRSREIEITKNPTGWTVKGGKGSQSSLDETVTWGTEKVNASKLIEKMLNHKDIVVIDEYKEDGQTVRVFNQAATAAAQGKAEQIVARFEQWIWADPSRTERLLTDYNERFNSHVPRSYDDQGAALRIPGLALNFDLKPHQTAAIARMIAEPTTGLFHGVGAGKTLEMVCGVMEQKRLGLIQKPMVVVPNHMLAQFEREWLQAFPQAKILAADNDDIKGKSGRGNFAARVASSDWDAVITTQSAFQSLSVRPDTLRAYHDAQFGALRAWIEQTQKDDPNAKIRNFTRKLQNAEEQVKKQIAKIESGDGGLAFEDLGVDYLVVDEAHAYKNLSQPTALTRIIAGQSSNRAADLDMKLGFLRETYGDRVATFATATPVANTMGEMWVMTHYLRPDLLAEAGLDTFDEWAHQYIDITSEVEVKVTGVPTVTTKPSRFKNIPELMATWSTFGDTKTQADMQLPIPLVAVNLDGKREPQIAKVDLGETMDQFNAVLLDRADKLAGTRPGKGQDNWLSLTGDGRAMATDYRLLKGDRADRALKGVDAPEYQKVNAVADQVARIWEETRDNTYLDDLDQISATKGALQLVFCDEGTPKTGEWDWYNELKDQLIERGLPTEKIAFAHDAKNTVEKDRLFARARTGSISVLVGSTEKMGTGANMQDRCVALHHVTAPWRPADLTQRDGRILRQGNQNGEVRIFRYVTEGSMDTYLWQTLERKAKFLDQVLAGNSNAREVQDIGLDEASYAQVKAIASGMPELMEEARLKNEVSTLRSRSNGFAAEQRYLTDSKRDAQRRVNHLEERREYIKPLIAQIQDTKGEKFSMSIQGTTYTDRKEAAAALGQMATSHHYSMNPRFVPNAKAPNRQLTGLISLGGVTFDAWIAGPQVGESTNAPRDVILSASHYDKYSDRGSDAGVRISQAELRDPTVGTILKLENHLRHLASEPERIQVRIDDARAQMADVESKIGGTDPWADKLAQAQADLKAIQAEIERLQDGQAPVQGLSAVPAANAETLQSGPTGRNAAQPERDASPPPHPGAKAAMTVRDMLGQIKSRAETTTTDANQPKNGHHKRGGIHR